MRNRMYVKRVIATVLCTVICVVPVLTGCGDKKNENNTQSSQTSTQSSESNTQVSTQSSQTDTQTSTQSNESTSQTGESSFADATGILTAMWDGYDDEKFPCYGGDINNPVDGAPGAADISSTDTFNYVLYVPESLQGEVTEAATLIHYMNANTFTSAALKVSSSDVNKFVSDLKDAIFNTQFVCGIPEKLVIATAGDYVIYAFGAEDCVAPFENSVTKNIEGAKVEVSQLFE